MWRPAFGWNLIGNQVFGLQLASQRIQKRLGWRADRQPVCYRQWGEMPTVMACGELFPVQLSTFSWRFENVHDYNIGTKKTEQLDGKS